MTENECHDPTFIPFLDQSWGFAQFVGKGMAGSDKFISSISAK